MFAAPDQGVVFGGMRKSQIASVGVGLVVGILSLQTGGLSALAGFVASVLMTGFLCLYEMRGRPLDQMLPAVARFGWQRLRRQTVWTRSETEQVGVREWSPPPSLAGVTIGSATVAGVEMAALKSAFDATWTGVIRVRSRNFATLAEEEQLSRLQGWSGILASLARYENPVSKLQWIERTVPEDGASMTRFFEANGLKGGLAAESYAKLLASARPVSQMHEHFVVVQIDGRDAAKGLIKKNGDDDRAALYVLFGELQNVKNMLGNCGLDIDGVLSYRELEEMLDSGFDPDARVAGYESSWPMETETSWGSYRVDGFYHATFWVAELPRVNVGPAFLAPLLISRDGISRTISLTCSAKSIRKAIKDVQQARFTSEKEGEWLESKGQSVTVEGRKRTEALSQREEELAVGHADTTFSMFITVSAKTQDGLDKAAAKVVQTGYQAQIELRRLWGQQDSGFATSLPLCRGLG